MSDNNSWLRLYRKMESWDWFTDSKTLHVFIYLLIRANYRDTMVKGRKILRGQVMTSYLRIATATGMSISSARRALDNLVSTGEITLDATNRYTVITIVKFDYYQDRNSIFEQTDEQAGEQTKEQHHKKNIRRKKEKSSAVSESKPAQRATAEPKTESNYIPWYWERNIPEKYYGKFQTEDEWWAYVSDHQEEVEAAYEL